MGRRKRKKQGQAVAAKPRRAIAPRRPHIGWVLISMAVWFAIIVGHFFVCAHVAHWLGSPNKLPPSLKGVDEIFNSGISGALDLLLALVWMAIVVITLIVPTLAAYFVEDALPRRVRPAVMDGMIYLIPIAGITLLTLFILPFESQQFIDQPTGLETAEMVSFDAFLTVLLTGLFAILTIVVLFVGLFLAAMFFMEHEYFGGIPELFAAVLFGIVCALVFAFFVGPYVLWLADQIGATRAIIAFLGGCTILFSVPAMWLSRGDSRARRRRARARVKARQAAALSR